MSRGVRGGALVHARVINGLLHLPSATWMAWVSGMRTRMHPACYTNCRHVHRREKAAQVRSRLDIWTLCLQVL